MVSISIRLHGAQADLRRCFAALFCWAYLVQKNYVGRFSMWTRKPLKNRAAACGLHNFAQAVIKHGYYILFYTNSAAISISPR
jgi:hypothetical protein